MTAVPRGRARAVERARARQRAARRRREGARADEAGGERHRARRRRVPARVFGGNVTLDEERKFYEALGNKKIFTLRTLAKALWRPLTTYREVQALGERLKEKGVEGNRVGEGLVAGGVMVFAPAADEPGFTHLEDTGKELPIAEIQAAVDRLCQTS